MAQKLWVELLQLVGLLKEHVGGVFTLGSTPIVAQSGHWSGNFTVQWMGHR
jgi:hypothetical protein